MKKNGSYNQVYRAPPGVWGGDSIYVVSQLKIYIIL